MWVRCTATRYACRRRCWRHEVRSLRCLLAHCSGRASLASAPAQMRRRPLARTLALLAGTAPSHEWHKYSTSGHCTRPTAGTAHSPAVHRLQGVDQPEDHRARVTSVTSESPPSHLRVTSESFPSHQARRASGTAAQRTVSQQHSGARLATSAPLHCRLPSAALQGKAAPSPNGCWQGARLQRCRVRSRPSKAALACEVPPPLPIAPTLPISPRELKQRRFRLSLNRLCSACTKAPLLCQQPSRSSHRRPAAVGGTSPLPVPPQRCYSALPDRQSSAAPSRALEASWIPLARPPCSSPPPCSHVLWRRSLSWPCLLWGQPGPTL